ncbi:MAG TPA: DNA repair protein RecO [Burkholderiales bacterium]|jgi:DNA repair protein RecO (recombination protein O)|nr:DNA repair protein RecO [Burkholderiales bacterium]
MRRRTDREPAFVLHSYPYKETSLIVEVFARHRGRVGLLARGARRPRSAIRGTLLAFHPLRLSWSASAELGTLTAAEWSGGQPALQGQGLMCGFYLNELLLKLLPREDAHERLFDAYAESLAHLAAGADHAALLRGFERRLLTELGYAPLLERDAATGMPVVSTARYAYEPERGPLAAAGGRADAEALTVSGQTLLDMARDDYARRETRDEARRLMRWLIGARLGGQSLHTREVLQELQEL